MPEDVAVCVAPDEAHRLVVAGRRVVLIVPEGATAPEVGEGAAGRLAVLVGDPGDAAVRAAAAAMGADVFGT